MSDSPTPPVGTEQRPQDVIPERKQARRYQQPSENFTITTVAISAAVVGVAVVVVSLTKEWDRSFAIAGVVIAAATGGIVAYFTKRLTFVTEAQHEASAEQDGRLDKTVSTLGEVKLAIEGQAQAMLKVADAIQAAAEASQASVALSRRSFAAQFPANLRVANVELKVADDDSITIVFELWNEGVADATVGKVWLDDLVPFRDDGLSGPGQLDGAGLAGAVVPSHRFISGVHTCQNIRKSDLKDPPPVTFPAIGLLPLTPVAADPTKGPLQRALDILNQPPEPRFTFSGFITFEHEGVQFEMLDISMRCRPDQRRFENPPSLLKPK